MKSAISLALISGGDPAHNSGNFANVEARVNRNSWHGRSSASRALFIATHLQRRRVDCCCFTRRRTVRAATISASGPTATADGRPGGRHADRRQANSSYPSTLIFAYTPSGGSRRSTPRRGTASSSTLEKITGKKVIFFPVQSNAAQYEAMRSGRLHMAGVQRRGAMPSP